MPLGIIEECLKLFGWRKSFLWLVLRDSYFNVFGTGKRLSWVVLGLVKSTQWKWAVILPSFDDLSMKFWGKKKPIFSRGRFRLIYRCCITLLIYWSRRCCLVDMFWMANKDCLCPLVDCGCGIVTYIWRGVKQFPLNHNECKRLSLQSKRTPLKK